jgi:hypothetical protein
VTINSAPIRIGPVSGYQAISNDGIGTIYLETVVASIGDRKSLQQRGTRKIGELNDASESPSVPVNRHTISPPRFAAQVDITLHLYDLVIRAGGDQHRVAGRGRIDPRLDSG